MSKENLYNEEAREKLRSIVDDVSIAMMVTNLGKQPLAAIPMDTKKVDDDGNIWFLSGMDSDHNANILRDSAVQLLYSGPGDRKFLSVYGEAQIITDTEAIEDIYDSADNAYLNGPEDSNTTAIKFVPQEAAYWDSDENRLVVLFKMARAVLTGDNQDIGVTGKMKL
ncbi:MAG: pyridoxamine 5'-phosphate oxidase family protein [Altibacter sp.]|uniref:pyridoxamine 5'-phosphate oxidase family protein n=1 Tax=Altibacter lentus TaxID=1223410 RepID=UPI00054DDF04|nr:pyridoxamine 5'-phosphate oxidase family protein [Altibacter lentus]MCW8980467.1 pyridoxamine 5'-phosphate oxidase family protein [Altibacter sp.]